jgi:hypothetical protein
MPSDLASRRDCVRDCREEALVVAGDGSGRRNTKAARCFQAARIRRLCPLPSKPPLVPKWRMSEMVGATDGLNQRTLAKVLRGFVARS